MPDGPSIDLVTSARVVEIAEDIDNFKAALDAIAEKWKSQIIELLAHPTNAGNASRLRQLAYLQTQVQAQLERLGYGALVTGFIGNYDAAQQAAFDSLAAIGVATERLAPLNSDALRTLKGIDFAKLIKAGADTANAVSQNVVLNAIGGLPRSKIIENIQATLDADFKNLAGTYADTGLVSYDRRVHWESFQGAGIEKFLYYGPDDIKTRPWCEKHVGKIFTKAEIDGMSNGTRLEPVWLYGGGYSCRHVWQPSLGTK